MSIWSRFRNALRPNRLTREIDDELESHLAEAIEHGRDPADAKRAFGSVLRERERSRDIRLLPWLDSLRADAMFGLRQLKKRKVTSAAAILSLALAIGSSTSAFRLIDALLLRPLPIASPESLYLLSRESIGADGNVTTTDASNRLLFRMLREAVKDQVELVANSHAMRIDLTYRSDQEAERAYMQYVSGWMFDAFGLQPAAGRTLSEHDDLQPSAHPYVVLSHDYWTRRFAQNPQAVGSTFRLNGHIYEIVGVAPERFTGTNPGTITDVFIPTSMSAGDGSDWSWFRTFVRLKPGIRPGVVFEKMRAAFGAYKDERLKTLTGLSQQQRDRFLAQKLLLDPAGAGVSGLQEVTRRPLMILAVLIALVLLIACVNVANLMSAQAAARAREMALRVSIGAGRWRLVQLVLVESAWLACLASTLGAFFAWWATPLVVGMINRSDNPARLYLPMDWRVVAFGAALTVAVTFLFGLMPALRASAVRPSFTLRGGGDASSRRRTMHVLIAAQVAFCFVVLFVAGLLIRTFDRLADQPLGFSAERILNLECTAPRAQTAANWDQVAERLRGVPGVERVALAEWPLLSGFAWASTVSVNGAPPSEDGAYFLNASPGWIDTMKLSLIDGRDFRPSEASPSVAIVNETFAKHYFNGDNPVGKQFEYVSGTQRVRVEIAGLVRDIRYRDMREPLQPLVLVPFRASDARGAELNSRSRRDAAGASIRATFVVRTAGDDPQRLASALRQEVMQVASELRITDLRTQQELVRNHMVRERLLALLAMFFAGVALLLAGIGLYGVLDYSVLQRRREIGIRLAIGARAGDIVGRVTAPVLVMVIGGSLAGLGLGLGAVRYVAALLYEVKATDATMLALPWLTVLAATLLAAIPAVIRALRIDPVEMLRSD